MNKPSAEGMHGGWLSLSRKELCKTRILKLVSERSRCLRTGTENDFISFECCDWVNVIATTEANELVMIRQFRHGSSTTEIEIPGGGMEKSDADPVAAGARELLEETGYAGTSGRVIGFVRPNPAIQKNICHTVKFDNVRKVSEPDLEATEDVETALIHDSKVLDMVMDGSIRHGLVINALLFHWLERGAPNLKEALK